VARTGADGLYGTLPAAADALACKRNAKIEHQSAHHRTECTGLTHPTHRAGWRRGASGANLRLGRAAERGKQLLRLEQGQAEAVDKPRAFADLDVNELADRVGLCEIRGVSRC
jgi:hypothetical protein